MKSLKELYKIGRGPSSSHTIAPQRACKEILRRHPNGKNYKVTLFGSLAFTGRGHLTDYVIKETLGCDTNVDFDLVTTKSHPNTFIIEVTDEKVFSYQIKSIGGGDYQIEGEELYEPEDVYDITSWGETKDYLLKNNLSIPDYIISKEGNDILEYLETVYQKMRESVASGLKKEGMLPGTLGVVRKAKMILNKETPKVSDIRQKIYAYAFAVNEENASAEEVVTAPTCGASGVVPALLFSMEEEHAISHNKIIEALMVAGLFGNFIKHNGSISGAVAGCQAEIGAACAMGAAGACYLIGGDLDEIEQAAEMALEHHLGLTCDPIGGYVQIPCIERSAVCAIRALDCAKLSKYIETGTHKISFDSVVETMLSTGRAMHENYRETSNGGLAESYKRRENKRSN